MPVTDDTHRGAMRARDNLRASGPDAPTQLQYVALGLQGLQRIR